MYASMHPSRLLLLCALTLAACGGGFIGDPPEDVLKPTANSTDTRVEPVPSERAPGQAPNLDAFEIAPLERIVPPIRRVSLRFAPDRLTLTDEESRYLATLAVRLRGTNDRVQIVSEAAAMGDADVAVRRAFQRGLVVREHLLEGGVAVEQIIVDALPAANLAGEDRVRLGPAKAEPRIVEHNDGRED